VTRHQQVEAIAQRFADVLINWLSPAEFMEMRRRNRDDVTYANGACASHDFCDANMAMMEAFESVTGHNMIPLDDGEISEEDCAIWNDAWNLARKLYIGAPKS
jgi:hypothetical protein